MLWSRRRPTSRVLLKILWPQDEVFPQTAHVKRQTVHNNKYSMYKFFLVNTQLSLTERECLEFAPYILSYISIVSMLKKSPTQGCAWVAAPLLVLYLGPHMFWPEVDIGRPGVHLRLHPPAGVKVLHLLLCLLFFTGSFQFFFIRANPLGAASPETNHLLGLCLGCGKTWVTHGADPQPLGRVNVSDHRSLLGACAADDKATFSAVVSALPHVEPVGAAHADRRGMVRDPGDGESGPGKATTAL